jgi:hypothetical protein
MGRLPYHILFVIARQFVLPQPKGETRFARRTGSGIGTWFAGRNRRLHVPGPTLGAATHEQTDDAVLGHHREETSVP